MNYVQNIILGIKHAYNLPILPKKISDFYNHIFTRIFRFTGGLSVLITITKAFDYINIQDYFNSIISDIIIFITFLWASIFMIFYIIISFIKITYGIYQIIKNPKIFEIRNSL